MANLFDFKEYKPYLTEVLGSAGTRTGQRLKLSQFLGIQTAYVSQVLGKDANFSLEQAFKINRFLNHVEDESDYFILLVQKARAGTKELEDYFSEKINEIHSQRKKIKNRVSTTREISKDDQNTYYSQWFYLAIHMALSVPDLQSADALCEYFHLPRATVMRVLDFLIRTGLAQENENRYSIGQSHIHLGNDSSNIYKHHSNWRMQAIRSLDRNRNGDLHYSVSYSVSRADAEKIYEKLIRVLKENLEIVGPSKEETLYCNTIDFFELKE